VTSTCRKLKNVRACLVLFLFMVARYLYRCGHYVLRLFLWSRASKRAQRPLCFCAVFSYSFFFYFFYFYFYFFLCHEICRKVIVSNAFAYGTEIWQVDSLWKYADRMFISHKSAEGFQRGRDAYHTFLAFLACRHGWRCAGRYGLQRIKLTAVHGFGMMR
jgi:hypothetical protein